MVACARKRSRMAVAAGTPPRNAPQSWVGRFRGDQRRARFMSPHEDLEQIFSRARAEFLHAEILEDQQVDARQLLDEVATSAGRFGLGEIRREVKRAADERASAAANRADSQGRDRRQPARHSANLSRSSPRCPPWPADPGARAVSPAPCNAIAPTGLAPATRDWPRKASWRWWPSPAVLMAAASASSAGWSNAP